ncbi:MAG: acyltransferase [Actinomycetia bacterium]|nr:acyltransferase [Actinomycetes bacterium]
MKEAISSGEESPTRPAVSRMPYLGGIDGIRALAVLAVVAYHLDAAWMPGGFFGVEVFFAVSGYLITALLVREVAGSGRVDLVGFWTRRARRLLPTLGVTLVGVLTWVSLFDTALADRVRREGVAAVGYLTNWYLILRQESYFDGFGRPSPLRHLWSLAIEEQFYLVWPILLAAGLGLFGKRLLALLILAGAAGSTALMFLWFEPYADPTRVYFGTDTRASGLLLGAALALLWRPWEHTVTPSRARHLGAMGVMALVGLAWLLATLGEFSPGTYQGGFLAVSVLTCVAVAAASVPDGWFGRALAWRPLRLVGVRSYALYLVHWPVVVYTRPGIDLDLPDGQVLAIRIALIVALTEAAHQLVEVPIRRGHLAGRSRRLRLPTPRLQLSDRGVIATLGLTVVLAASASLAFALDRPEQIDPSQPTALALSSPTEPGPETPRAETDASTTDPAPAAVVRDEIGPALPPLDVAHVQQVLTVPAATEEPLAAAPEPQQDLVLLIGDSVARGADEALAAEMGNSIIVDASVSRQFRHTVAVLGAYLDEGLDPSTVVVHLGTNGALTGRDVDEVAGLVGPDRRLVLLTVLVPRPWQNVSNETLSEGAARWCNSDLIDWRSLAAGSPDWIGSDGVHLTTSGADAYAKVLASVLSSAPLPIEAFDTIPPDPAHRPECE